jgi:hypothetical protein
VQYFLWHFCSVEVWSQALAIHDSDEVGVLLLEPGNQAKWTVRFVIIVHGD